MCAFFMSIKIYLVKFSFEFHFIMYINVTLYLSNSIIMAVSLPEAIVLTYAIIQPILSDNSLLAPLDMLWPNMPSANDLGNVGDNKVHFSSTVEKN